MILSRSVFLADRLLDQRTDLVDIQVRFDQLGVGRGHVAPRFARRKDDLRQLRVFRRQIVFRRLHGRQRTEIEDQHGTSVFFRADRFGIAVDDFIFQRQRGGGVDHQAELAHRVLLAQQEAFYDAVVEQRADLAGFDFLFHDRAHDDRRQRPAEQLLVAEEVRRILLGRGLADALLIQGVGLAVGRDHADAEDRLFFAPRRPIGLGAGPVIDAFFGEEAVDPPRGAMLPALFVELIEMLFEEHFHVAVFRRRRRGRRPQDVLRLGREGRQVPGRFHLRRKRPAERTKTSG